MSGTLEVTLIAARELKNKDGLFGSNDPYAIIKLGGQKFKTEVKKKAGKECQWNQTFRLGVTEKMTELVLEVYDEDMVSDDLIGKTKIPLQGILQTGYVDAWYTIGKGSKSHGEVHAMIRFTPGAFPQGFDPNAFTFDDGAKIAGGVVGGALAAAALGYGAKMAYDHYNKKDGQPKPQEQQQQSGGYGSMGGGNQPGYAGSTYSNNSSNSGYGGQPQQGGYGGQQHQGGYGGQPQQGGHGGQQQHQQGGFGGPPQSGGYGSQSGTGYSGGMPEGPNQGGGYNKY